MSEPDQGISAIGGEAGTSALFRAHLAAEPASWNLLSGLFVTFPFQSCAYSDRHRVDACLDYPRRAARTNENAPGPKVTSNGHHDVVVVQHDDVDGKTHEASVERSAGKQQDSGVARQGATKLQSP